MKKTIMISSAMLMGMGTVVAGGSALSQNNVIQEAEASPLYQYGLKKEAVKIRYAYATAYPNTDSSTVYIIHTGRNYDVLRTYSNGYFQIKYGTRTLWLHSSAVTSDKTIGFAS